MTDINSGLEGVVAASTHLSHVDGDKGELIIAGYPVEELAPRATFEETTWLLWNGRLPDRRQLDDFRSELISRRSLSAATLALLRECARVRADPMDALRMALDTVSLSRGDSTDIVAQ